MSLLSFLQQTLMKDVQHHILQQIQSSHSAAESLLDQLSSLKSLNKIQILEKKINSVKSYISLKESIYRALNGLQPYNFETWTKNMFKNNSLVSQLIKMQKPKIEALLTNTLKRVFLTDMDNSSEDMQQQQKVTIYLSKLKKLKQNEQQNIKTSRQQILYISQSDKQFQKYMSKLQDNVDKFNQQIQRQVQKIRAYDEKIRLQFQQLLSGDSNSYTRQSPFKKLGSRHVKQQEYEPSEQVSNQYEYQQYYRPSATNLYFDNRREMPTRDIFYYGTM